MNIRLVGKVLSAILGHQRQTMAWCRTPVISLAKGVSLCLLLTAPVAQAQQVDPEWPCIQRLITVISPAIMWPIPVEDDLSQRWKSDDEVRPLAEHLGDLERFTDAEREAIETFAAAQNETDLEDRLSLLAVGVVGVTNKTRQHYIEGIKRYTRQQIDISHQIEESLNKLSVLGDDESSESLAAQSEIRDTLYWHERVYDQRERAILSLCEKPVELEERLSEVLREAAYYLP